MSKVWSFFLLVAGLLWLGDAVAVWFGYDPSKFTMFVAFLITGGVTLKWAYEAYIQDEK